MYSPSAVPHTEVPVRLAGAQQVTRHDSARNAGAPQVTRYYDVSGQPSLIYSPVITLGGTITNGASQLTLTVQNRAGDVMVQEQTYSRVPMNYSLVCNGTTITTSTTPAHVANVRAGVPATPPDEYARQNAFAPSAPSLSLLRTAPRR